jgi:hypothetical protein
MTTIAPEDELILLAEELSNPACEFHADGADPDSPACGAEAKWALIFSCSCVSYFCDEHKPAMTYWISIGRWECNWHHVDTVFIRRWEKL